MLRSIFSSSSKKVFLVTVRPLLHISPKKCTQDLFVIDAVIIGLQREVNIVHLSEEPKIQSQAKMIHQEIGIANEIISHRQHIKYVNQISWMNFLFQEKKKKGVLIKLVTEQCSSAI